MVSPLTRFVRRKPYLPTVAAVPEPLDSPLFAGRGSKHDLKGNIMQRSLVYVRAFEFAFEDVPFGNYHGRCLSGSLVLRKHGYARAEQQASAESAQNLSMKARLPSA